VLKRDYAGQECSIARSLEIVGERWTLLIVRDVFLGRRRFDQSQESLGVARNVLSERLARLVEEGILERRAYCERPMRYEYELTPKGRGLSVALAALRQWGDEHLSERPQSEVRRRTDGRRVVAAFVPEGSPTLHVDEVEIVRPPRP
jgi:DNA-binding HxlR family transcriptional regulator